jgi:hypothetical protein
MRHVPLLVCRPSTLHGRGIFATTAVRTGQVVDSGPVLLIDDDEISETLIGWYVFSYDDDRSALCLGHASMLNHSTNPNAEVHFDEEGPSYSVIAVRAIPAGAEITIDYGPDYGL